VSFEVISSCKPRHVDYSELGVCQKTEEDLAGDLYAGGRSKTLIFWIQTAMISQTNPVETTLVETKYRKEKTASFDLRVFVAF